MANTFEYFNVIQLSDHGKNVAIKIDMDKAFDTMQWAFILKVMSCFGFDDTFLGWVWNPFA